MNYFVTGAFDFVGSRLVAKLLQHGGTVYILMQKQSLDNLEQLQEIWGLQSDRVIPIIGDLTEARLGVCQKDLGKLKGKINHFFHLDVSYDLNTDAESQYTANVEGTRHTLEFAETIETGCFHHLSSIAAAGMYDGVFREDMFEEATGLKHPYFSAIHDSEALVRRQFNRPWRIYRPGVIVGDSQNGEMDKIDGPYYLFKLIQKVRRILPPWMPTIGLEGGHWNIVPVDFVVNAMDYIAHLDGKDGHCFHLTDPNPHYLGEVLNIFARAGHAPTMAIRLNARMFGFIPSYVIDGLAKVAPIRHITKQILQDLGIPKELFQFINKPTRFDCRETTKALQGTDIKVPPLEDYAWKLWDYWERYMDPDLFVDHSLKGKVNGRVAMVTGGSSGIGKATALKLASAGATVLLVARDEDKLRETRDEIQSHGGCAYSYSCDLTDMTACDRLVKQVMEKHGGIDFLVNNAGRSIRRSIALSFDRFHDFERTMQLNYFGSLRMTMGFLPSMLKQQHGHIINISSIGVLTNAPRFSAYVASKAALDAFSRCAGAEFTGEGIHFTTINMPLVRTPMIAPTKLYQNVPTINPEDAADLVAEAIIFQPKRIVTRLGKTMWIAYAIAPKLIEIIMNTAFRLFPESAAASGKQEKEVEATPEMVAFAQLIRGIHW